jgi:hypothetical protein
MRDYAQQYLPITPPPPQRTTENSFYLNTSGQDQLPATIRIYSDSNYF